LDINDIAHLRVQDSFRNPERTAHTPDRQEARISPFGVGPTLLHKRGHSISLSMP
jgi:hypothetical protein